jgi:tetratricopeptide (TPR) repeat protein
MAWFSPRALQLRLHAERGTPEQAPAAEKLVSAARDTGLPGLIASTFSAAAQLLLARRQREQAQALLHEVGRLDAAEVDLGYASVLQPLLRVALALDDRLLAERLATGVEPVTPLHEHAVASARAQLAEAAGEHAEAAELYAEAAERWRAFGNVPERAYALLGQGRCQLALGESGADEPLRAARALFASMGYMPALAETEALLGESEAAAV